MVKLALLFPFATNLAQTKSGTSLFQFAECKKAAQPSLSLTAANAQRIGPNQPISRQRNRIRVSAPRHRRSFLSLMALFTFRTGVTESFEVIDGFIQQL